MGASKKKEEPGMIKFVVGATFSFLDSGLLPEGMVFDLSLNYAYWSFPGDGEEAEHYGVHTPVESMPDGGLEWTGVEISEWHGDANAPAVLYTLE